MKKTKRIIAIICLVALAAIALFQRFVPADGNTFKDLSNKLNSAVHDGETTTLATEGVYIPANAHGPYDVIRIVDGDTIIVRIDNEDVKVRFIGVNTPESVSEDESKNCEEGKIAFYYTKDLLAGKKVHLEYDKDREDKYGRTLAYVYLESGEMVNKLLLSKGYATTMRIEPNVKYAYMFEDIQAEAESNNIGFWGTGYYK